MVESYRIEVINVPNDNIVVIPENTMPLNVFYSPNDGRRMLAVLKHIEPESEEEGGG